MPACIRDSLSLAKCGLTSKPFGEKQQQHSGSAVRISLAEGDNNQLSLAARLSISPCLSVSLSVRRIQGKVSAKPGILFVFSQVSPLRICLHQHSASLLVLWISNARTSVQVAQPRSLPLLLLLLLFYLRIHTLSLGLENTLKGRYHYAMIRALSREKTFH